MSDDALYRVAKGADNFTMTRCRIETDNPVALSIEGVDGPTVTDNIFDGSPKPVEMNDVTNARVSGNTMRVPPPPPAPASASDPEKPRKRQPYRAQRPARRN